MIRRVHVTVAAALVALGVGAGAAGALFTDGVSTSGTVSTATLQPAAGVASTHPNATGANAGQVNLTWTPSTSTFVAGHRVQRAAAPGGPWSTVQTLGPAASAHNDTTAPYNAESYYRVQAFVGAWTADTAVRSTHSLPMQAGTDRVTGAGAGTALTGPWTTGGTQLAAVSVAGDGARYQPTTWPIGPTYVAGAHYLDATHAWASGTGSISFFNGTSWTAQSPGTAQSLEQVVFVDANRGWSVGAAGTIVATVNGGTNWTAQTSGTAQTLWDIECVSTTTCWAVGNGGVIVKTVNGGTNWAAQTSGTAQALWDVECVSATTCWVVGNGGVIRKTVNGGTNWTAQTSGVATRLLGVSCINANTCWASGDSGVIRTTVNGGTNWNAQASGTTQSIWRIQMFSATSGYYSGSAGQVRRTTDGTTWNLLTVPTADYYGMSCADATRCLIVSNAPSILLSSDSGATWGEGAAGYVELTPLTPTLAPGGAITSVVARLVYRTTTVPGAGSRFLLQASADAGATWTTFTLAAPAAANTDVTASPDLTAMGWTPATRAQNIRLRFVVIPRGAALTTQIDLAHVDLN